MKGSLRKAIALIMTFMMVWSCLPVNVMAEIIEASGSIQPFAVIQPDLGVYVTFEFYNEGEKVDTQIVTNGETLYAPTSPAKDGYKFVGWKTADGAIFNGFGQVSGYETSQTVTLTAAFEEVHYVFFHDDNGRIVATREGVYGDRVQADVTFDTGLNMGISGWYTTPEFTGDAVTQILLANMDIHLYAKVETGSWLSFDSQGGTPINAAFYLPNEVTVKPADPTREGYTFSGWQLNGQNYNFGSTIAENTDLTAVWTPKTVNYTVIYWLENALDDEYTYYSSSTLTGQTGTKTNASGLRNTPEGFTLKSQNGQLVDPQGNSVQQTIAGDGSTIVNVYYARNVYDMNFWSNQKPEPVCGLEEHTHTWQCYEWWELKCGKVEHTHTDACYGDVEIRGDWYLYTRITAKHGAPIKWPGGTWYVEESGSTQQSFAEIMPIGGDDFYWRTENEEPGTVGNGDYADYYVERLD